MAPEMLGTTLEISNLHCQPSRQPLVETCLTVDGRTKDKDWKTNKHMGCANTHVSLMEKFGRMECDNNADRCLADTHELLYCIFHAQVVRTEIRLAVVVSLRSKGAAFGQASSTRLCRHTFLNIFHVLIVFQQWQRPVLTMQLRPGEA